MHTRMRAEQSGLDIRCSHYFSSIPQTIICSAQFQQMTSCSIFANLFFFFLQKIGFDICCKLSPKKMHNQGQFSWENRKKKKKKKKKKTSVEILPSLLALKAAFHGIQMTKVISGSYVPVENDDFQSKAHVFSPLRFLFNSLEPKAQGKFIG